MTAEREMMDLFALVAYILGTLRVEDVQGLAVIKNQLDEVSQWLSEYLDSLMGRSFAFHLSQSSHRGQVLALVSTNRSLQKLREYFERK